MSEQSLFGLLAQYNASMNVKLYQAAAQLSAEQLAEDKGAFFGSLIGTLNHIVAGDTIWLQRFAQHPARFSALQAVQAMPAPSGLTAIYSSDLATLSRHRSELDDIIGRWVSQVTEDDLQHVLHYRNTKGTAFQKRFAALVLHFFNHQTHHRGQASTLLHQAGVDIGVTDLLASIADEG